MQMFPYPYDSLLHSTIFPDIFLLTNSTYPSSFRFFINQVNTFRTCQHHYNRVELLTSTCINGTMCETLCKLGKMPSSNISLQLPDRWNHRVRLSACWFSIISNNAGPSCLNILHLPRAFEQLLISFVKILLLIYFMIKHFYNAVHSYVLLRILLSHQQIVCWRTKFSTVSTDFVTNSQLHANHHSASTVGNGLKISINKCYYDCKMTSMPAELLIDHLSQCICIICVRNKNHLYSGQSRWIKEALHMLQT